MASFHKREVGNQRTMLEKFGRLPKPAVPAVGGNEWVVDAVHCQGCTSAFSIFNRKHHCRRCGGVFCGNCTRQRMILRQQGEDPVRVCDPCKKLEDAARFESRYGHRNRGSRGSSETSSQMEADLLLKELIANEGSPQTSGRTDFVDSRYDVVPLFQDNKFTSMGKEKACLTSMSIKTEKAVNQHDEHSFLSPEILRQRAQEEKRRWNTLKKEGKGEEALQAFKQGRELERQAETLEMSLKRSQRRAANSALVRKEKHEEHNGSEGMSRSQSLHSTGEGQEASDSGIDPVNLKQVGKESEEKDDLISALKDLGWDNADLHDSGIKQSKTRNVESELAELVAEVRHVEGSNHLGDVSSMQVLAHKRRALALKREGKLAEAKEELKKAKNMERRLEEQVYDGEETDDDLAALIRGLEKEDMTQTTGIANLDMAGLVNLVHEDDEEVEVTHSEMDDPEMVAALKSMGWEEEAVAMEKSMPTASDKHSALASKQHGKNPFGSAGVKLQESAEGVIGIFQNFNDNVETVHVTDEDMEDPYFLSALKAMGFAEENAEKLIQPVVAAISTPFEKSNLKQEILFLKKEALVLKRAGKIQEAKEELRQARRLEKELEELKSHHMVEDAFAAVSGWGVYNDNKKVIQLQGGALGEEIDLDNFEVTGEDMGDPEIANALKLSGWEDEDTMAGDVYVEKRADAAAPNLRGRFSEVDSVSHLSKTRSELQRELLGLKRAALKFKREGRVEEAEDELKKARVLERLIEEPGIAAVAPKKEVGTEKLEGFAILENDDDEVTEDDMKDPVMLAALKGFGWNESEKDAEMMPRALLDKASSSLPVYTSTLMEKTSQASDFEQKADHKTSMHCRDNELDSADKIDEGGEFNSDNESGGICAPIEPPPADFKGKTMSAKADDPYSAAVGDLLTGDFWGPDQAKGRGGIDVGVLDPNLRKTLQWPEVESFTTENVIGVKLDKVVMPQSGVRVDVSIPASKAPVNSRIQMTVGSSLVLSDSMREDAESVDNVLTWTPSVQTLQQDILVYKRKALALKREGRQAEAKEELRNAKMLERKLVLQNTRPENIVLEDEFFHTSNLSGNARSSSKVEPEIASSMVSAASKATPSQQAGRSLRHDAGSHDFLTCMTSSGATQMSAQKYTSGKDRLKLQQESLAHKRKALALRREGRMEDAEAEFDLAKSIEKKMEELEGSDEAGTVPTGLAAGPLSGQQEKDDASAVDDIFDPQLLGALRGLGWKESNVLGQIPKPGQVLKEKLPIGSNRKNDMALNTKYKQNKERQQLEEMIRSEKARAVQLKRSGQQFEALDVLRGAKQLEKKLQLMCE